MPLPSDEELVKTSGDVVAQLQAIFGKHPGFRPGQIISHSEEDNYLYWYISSQLTPKAKFLVEFSLPPLKPRNFLLRPTSTTPPPQSGSGFQTPQEFQTSQIQTTMPIPVESESVSF
jgi:hypothetical protein